VGRRRGVRGTREESSKEGREKRRGGGQTEEHLRTGGELETRSEGAKGRESEEERKERGDEGRAGQPSAEADEGRKRRRKRKKQGNPNEEQAEEGKDEEEERRHGEARSEGGSVDPRAGRRTGICTVAKTVGKKEE
jgi:hypothetical protein